MAGGCCSNTRCSSRPSIPRVISDWGSSILAAQELGPKAKCLVDLGHHAPNVNIEQIVARLHRFGKLGGFHFNDSKYGDDDLDSGSINPHQLFLVFNELVEAELHPRDGFDPAYMIDQSHNVTDPIECMMSSPTRLPGYAKALLVDREALHAAQEANDTMMAFQALRRRLQHRCQPDPCHGARGSWRCDRRARRLPRQRLARAEGAGTQGGGAGRGDCLRGTRLTPACPNLRNRARAPKAPACPAPAPVACDSASSVPRRACRSAR